jgi:GH24 family phage-related lysozyme (muramidase)
VVYPDSEGFPTIGYGHKLTKDEIANNTYAKGIDKKRGAEIYAADVARTKSRFHKANPEVAKKYPPHVVEALEDMAYNMGERFLQKFPKANEKLQKGDYYAAGNEFLDSNYAKQVKQRALDNAAMIAGVEAPKYIKGEPIPRLSPRQEAVLAQPAPASIVATPGGLAPALPVVETPQAIPAVIANQLYGNPVQPVAQVQQMQPLNVPAPVKVVGLGSMY